MNRCTKCSEVFDDPNVYPTRENLDGENGWVTLWTEICPFCGCEWFEEVGNG